jgi:hypothetical protein
VHRKALVALLTYGPGSLTSPAGHQSRPQHLTQAAVVPTSTVYQHVGRLAGVQQTSVFWTGAPTSATTALTVMLPHQLNGSTVWVGQG